MPVPATSRAHDTWLLSGIPRAGTSLCCRLAGGLANFVALSEPMETAQLGEAESGDAALAAIESFALRARARALREGKATSIHVDGALDDNRATNTPHSGAPREVRGERGDILIRGGLDADFTLVIKHNAPFAALLGRLVPLYPCVAVVRNPLAVLASWQTVPFPVAHGRLPAGERFDAHLKAAVLAESDTLARQLILLNWFFRQYRAHLPDRRIVRYEDVTATGGRALYRVLGRDGRAEPLQSRNGSAIYRGVDADRLLAALGGAGGAWTEFYTAADCRAAAEAIRGA